MHALTQQIVTLYEQDEIAPEMIAEMLELDSTAIKTALMQNSPRFRKDVKDGVKEFTETDYTRAKQVIANLLDSENDSVRLRAAKFVVDENKGRNDARVAAMQALALKEAPKVNVLMINETFLKARAALTKSLGGGEIDVEIVKE